MKNIILKYLSCIGMISCMIACDSSPDTLFTNVTESSGIVFQNSINETLKLNILTFEYMYNGGGVAIGDVNRDGLQDIYFTGNMVANKLFLNTGNLTFLDVTAKAGVSGRSDWATGVTMVDINADGWLDIYVCYSGKDKVNTRANEFFINQGIENGVPVFKEEAKAMGLDVPGSTSTQAVFFDYDRDSDLDMFLLNHATMFYTPFQNTKKLRTMRHPYFSNYLFRNDSSEGKRYFTDVSEKAGIKGGGNNFGLGVAVSDVNNDGWLDLYTTNDYEEQDFLYLNNHDGTFRDVTKISLKHISKYGMGCDIADYNNDGLTDIMVLDMLPEDNYRQKMLKGPDGYDKYHLLIDSGYFHQNMRNTLQLNNGSDMNGIPVFSEIGQLAGISNTDWSWTSLIADFNNDGWKDLYVTNGYFRDYTNMDFLTYTVNEYRKKYGNNVLLADLVKEMPQTQVPNYIYKNNKDLTFKDVTNAWGLSIPTVTTAAAYADLDNDGDLDLILNNMTEPAMVFKNNSNELSSNNFLKIQLETSGLNRFALGAKVMIESVSGLRQTYEVMPHRGYQSSVDPILNIGLGEDQEIEKIVVQWPTGKMTSHTKIKVNSLSILRPQSGTPVRSTGIEDPGYPRIFTDFTKQSGINFIHQENDYVDFKQEFLLPWQFSKQGPKLAKGDINGDNLEDIFIGAPAGQSSRLYIQTPDGNFKLADDQPWESDELCEDIESVFFDVDGDQDYDLYVVSGGNENYSLPSRMQDRLYLNDGHGNYSSAANILPSMTGSKACVAVADYNKDGKIDIFVGGRVVPGKYGVSPESYLLKNETQGNQIRFTNVAGIDASDLQYSGMITDAVWIDLNKDTWPDLVVVGEWMPVRIFMNNEGKLQEASQTNLTGTHGLWTGIFPFDAEGDGDTDFILGSLAPNAQFSAEPHEPMTLHVGDFDNNGVIDPLISYFIQGTSYPYASRNELLDQLPGLRSKFIRYADYADAVLKDVLSAEQLNGKKPLEVHTLKNYLLTNDGKGKFSMTHLPVQAQFSAIYGVFSGDFNQDTYNDVIVAGNFYPFSVNLGRQDASIGLLLEGDGKNNFIPIPFSQSGIMIDGDVRDMAVINTLKGDRILIIAKNNEPIQVLLFTPKKGPLELMLKKQN